MFIYLDSDGDYDFTYQEKSGEFPTIDDGEYSVNLESFEFIFDEGTEDEETRYLAYLDDDNLIFYQVNDDGELLTYYFKPADYSTVPASLAEPDFWDVVKIDDKEDYTGYASMDETGTWVEFNTSEEETARDKFKMDDVNLIFENGKNSVIPIFLNEEFFVTWDANDDQVITYKSGNN